MFLARNSNIFQKICASICKYRTNLMRSESTLSDRLVEEILTSDSEYDEVANEFMRLSETHRCLIIQPYVKWGPRKLTITPSEQLDEAVALIKTLPSWKVIDTIAVPLESLDRKALFKSGSMEKLTNMINKNPDISAVFINASNLKRITSTVLQENFRIPILDRYQIVMQILKIHATSKYAKLQVALAELYFVQRKAQTFFLAKDSETLKLMFHSREQKLKKAIQELRSQRGLLRNKRKKLDYPIIAVVGYTNAGKTCLIKALTGEESLQPRNQLFATLDVTVHAGILPSGLEVLYVDTVGFLSDLPTNLIECFVATLEDALLADVIIHVEDLASSCFDYKRNHVLKTLQDLERETDSTNIMDKVLNIGNKCDLVEETNVKDVLPISAKLGTGLEDLRHRLEQAVLKATSRHILTIKIPNGGDESRWLYKNATVISEIPDENDEQIMKTKVIITNANLSKFKHNFVRSK